MANEIDILIKARDDASRTLKKTGASIEKFSKQARMAAVALTAMSVAGIAAIKSLSSAAQEQKAAEQALQVAVENTGESYARVKDEIIDTVAALQAKTNFGDEEQMRALTLMTAITGDYGKALAALPLIMDTAAAKGRGMKMIAGTLTRVLMGQTDIADSLGVEFEKNTTFAERLAIGLGMVGGVAEAQADPFKQLGNDVGDVAQKMGAPFLEAITPAIDKLREWALEAQKADENTLKAFAAVSLLGTAFVSLGVPIALFLALVNPVQTGAKIIAGAIGSISAPFLLIAAGVAIGVAALVGFGVAWATNWEGIREKTAYIFGKIEDLYRSKLGWFLPGGPLVKGLLFIKDRWGSIWKGISTFTMFILEGIADGMQIFLEGLRSKLNSMIRIFNLINPFADIPEIGPMGTQAIDFFREARDRIEREYQKFMLIGNTQDISGGGATGGEMYEFGGKTQQDAATVILSYDGEMASTQHANLTREDNQIKN